MAYSRNKGSEWQRLSRIKWKAEAIAAFGGKCQKCGFADPRALQFDHKITGEGTALAKHGTKPSYYRRLMANKHHIQLLCANCNWIKRYENGELKKIGGKTSKIMKRYWAEVRSGKRAGPKHNVTS